jgi:hypothetical protein
MPRVEIWVERLASTRPFKPAKLMPETYLSRENTGMDTTADHWTLPGGSHASSCSKIMNEVGLYGAGDGNRTRTISLGI